MKPMATLRHTEVLSRAQDTHTQDEGHNPQETKVTPSCMVTSSGVSTPTPGHHAGWLRIATHPNTVRTSGELWTYFA